jgi:hypothetical protein
MLCTGLTYAKSLNALICFKQVGLLKSNKVFQFRLLTRLTSRAAILCGLINIIYSQLIRSDSFILVRILQL